MEKVGRPGRPASDSLANSFFCLSHFLTRYPLPETSHSNTLVMSFPPLDFTNEESARFVVNYVGSTSHDFLQLVLPRNCSCMCECHCLLWQCMFSSHVIVSSRSSSCTYLREGTSCAKSRSCKWHLEWQLCSGISLNASYAFSTSKFFLETIHAAFFWVSEYAETYVP